MVERYIYCIVEYIRVTVRDGGFWMSICDRTKFSGSNGLIQSEMRAREGWQSSALSWTSSYCRCRRKSRASSLVVGVDRVLKRRNVAGVFEVNVDDRERSVGSNGVSESDMRPWEGEFLNIE